MKEDNKKENYKPILSLSMDDKIYLAVAKDLTGTLSFVYTLACLRQGKNLNTFNMIPTREIHAFKTKEAASVYHDAIEKIVDANASDETKQPLFSANDKLIDRFMTIAR